MNYVKVYIVLCVNAFLFVKAQVVFDPDPEGDVQLQATPLTPNVSVSTVQCYSDPPDFKVQYVTPNGDKVHGIVINGNLSYEGSPVNGNLCNQSQSQFRVRLESLQFITDPVLVGETFRLKATLNSNEGSSTLSQRTYTFPAPLNLTGSSSSAVLYFNFTWTCHVTSEYPTIEWHRNGTILRQAGVSNDVCVTSGPNDSYIYNCQYSQSTYTLTIPGPNLTEELQNSTWRCRTASDETKGSKYMKLDLVYPPTVSLYLKNAIENTRNHTIICKAEGGKPNNATIIALQQRIGPIFIRNITSFTESSPGNITLTIPRVSYQDMGTYTCLASNGIPDKSNRTIQSDTAYFDVKTSARFEMMEYTVSCDIDTPANIHIPFYRNPPAFESDVVWTKNTGSSNETVVSSANITLSLGDFDVQQNFHGVDVTLKGQSANIMIPSFQNYYEGTYTLKIRSNHTDNAKVTIVLMRSAPVESTPSSLNIAVIGGAAGGGGALLVVIIVIIVVLKRRRPKEQGTEFSIKQELEKRHNINDEGGDGLKDNPVYGSNQCGANTVQGVSAGPENQSPYAEVVKQKKKDPAKQGEAPPHIYAEVNKSQKTNSKGKQKKQKAKVKAEGDKYPNVDGFNQNCSTDNQKTKENDQRGYRNKDGLFYMDVKFDQQPTRGKPTIRKEEPTGYAMIQFEEPNAKHTSNTERGAEGGR